MTQTTIIALGCPREVDNKILFLILWLYDMEKKSIKTVWEISSLQLAFILLEDICRLLVKKNH